MISTIRFEASRLFGKAVIIILISLVIASLYFTFLGVSEYKAFLQYKDGFFAAEESKTRLYMNYEQYGAAGFRVMLEPSALVVFFNRSDFVRDLKANIDTSEIINIYNGRKYKDAFSDDHRFGDLTQTVTVFGTLIMMVLGFLTFPNRHTIRFFGKGYLVETILSRLLPLNIFFLLLFVFNNVFARLLEVTFTANENGVFAFFALESLLLLNCFFAAGLVLKALFKYKKSAVTFLLVTWFGIIFVVPEAAGALRFIEIDGFPSVEKMNLEILETLLEAERSHQKRIRDLLKQGTETPGPALKRAAKELYDRYMTNEYIKIKNKEEVLIGRVKKSIDTFHLYSFLSPVDFLNTIASEASGKGYRGYLDFLHYVLDMRDRFLRYYGEKRYGTYEPGKDSRGPLEPFIKNRENIFTVGAEPPGTLVRGTTAMGLYLLMLYAAFSLMEREKTTDEKSPVIPGKVKRNNMFFLLTGRDKQERLFEALKQEDTNRLFLDAASHTIPNEEVTAAVFIDYVCRRKRIDKNEVKRNLETLGIGETDMGKKLSLHPWEARKKIICAAAFAGNQDIVINDFLKGVSHAFEKQFLALVSGAAAAGRKVVYVSSAMYSPASSLLKQDIDLNEYQLFQVEPQTVSLR